MKKRNLVFFGVIAALASSQALAIQNRTVSVTQTSDVNTLKQQSKNVVYFSQSGLSTEESPVMKSAGKGWPLNRALSKIIPSEWVIKPSGNYESAIVSWQGGISWPLIVRNISSNEAIFVHLDWVQKIASVHVPGDTNTEVALTKSEAKNMTDEDKQAFRKEQRQRWVLRDDASSNNRAGDDSVESLIKKYQASQDSNRQYIKDLNENNQSLERSLEEMKRRLDEERAKREAVENKYAVLNPVNAAETKDAVQLAKEYRERTVLPFDSSFNYFTNGGGHADVIDARTPATFIAKQGSVYSVIKSWADEMGWHVDKLTNVTHSNPYEREFKGTFIEVGIELVSIFENSKRPIDIRFISDVKYVDPDTKEVKHGVVQIIDYDYKANYNRTQPMSR